MNHIIYPIIGTVLIVGGFVLGRTTSPQPQQIFSGLQENLDAEKAAKIKVMAQYFKATERLKETPTVDLALGTSAQWSEGYAQAANDLEITLNGNENVNAISALMRTKLGQISKLCNDPNSTASIKGKDFVTPI